MQRRFKSCLTDIGFWPNPGYRKICFNHHKKECVICGENKIVAVHHFDEDHSNIDPENLIPLCPTHHVYWHSNYRQEIEQTVLDYMSSRK